MRCAADVTTVECLFVEGVRARVPHGNAFRRNVCGSSAVVPNVLQIAS